MAGKEENLAQMLKLEIEVVESFLDHAQCPGHTWTIGRGENAFLKPLHIPTATRTLISNLRKVQYRNQTSTSPRLPDYHHEKFSSVFYESMALNSST